ncbi:MAG: hypothetical protein IJ292_04570 [Clostridia bacterium]|nr:hypothetical protein [Clostridia bacterium]
MKPKYCSKCGKTLTPEGKCKFCKTNENSLQGVFAKIKAFILKLTNKMGIGSTSGQDALNVFEKNKKIIPDITSQNDQEAPIKQYDIAKLRSRILCKYADGRLQITNKRVIFRASGTSPVGAVTLHHEFSTEEIAGIEIKKTNRVSFLNIVLGIILTALISSPVYSMFYSFNTSHAVPATILGYFLIVGLLVPFFMLKKMFWIKLCSLSAALGIILGLADLTAKAVDYMFGRSLFDLTDGIAGIIILVWIFNMILVSLVPDLRICIKTKSAGDAMQIRRKTFSLFKQPEEHTGFSEVLPWKDTTKAIKEIGAIIDDIQTMGDLAIDKWKEN